MRCSDPSFDSLVAPITASTIARFSIPVIAAIALSLGSPLAHAVSFNFATIAQSNEGGLKDGHTILPSSGTGITVDVSAISIGAPVGTPAGAPFAYLDDKSSGRPAGLGVCRNLNGSDTGTSGNAGTATQVVAGSDCSPSSDDNLTTGELLKLSFSETVKITDALFRDANHFLFGVNDTDDFNFCIGANCDDAGDIWINDQMGDPDLLEGSEGMMFSFIVDDIACNSGCRFVNDSDQLYINVIDAVGVPEPASLLLLGLGLLGVGRYSARRTRT